METFLEHDTVDGFGETYDAHSLVVYGHYFQQFTGTWSYRSVLVVPVGERDHTLLAFSACCEAST